MVKIRIEAEMGDWPTEQAFIAIPTAAAIILCLIKENSIESFGSFISNLIVTLIFRDPLTRAIQRLTTTILTEQNLPGIFNLKNLVALISLIATSICIGHVAINNNVMRNRKFERFLFMCSVSYLLRSAQRLVNYSSLKDSGRKLIPYITSIVIIGAAISVSNMKNDNNSKMFIVYIISTILICTNPQIFGENLPEQEKSEIFPTIVAILLTIVITIGVCGLNLNYLGRLFNIINSKGFISS